MQPIEIDYPCTFFSKVLSPILPHSWPSAFFCAVGCLTTYRKREISSRFSCICLPPVYENPIILDDFSEENPSFKPATKVVRVEHLLNFSSGLFYDGIIVLPYSYTAKHDEEDPVGHFYIFIKVRRPSRCYKCLSFPRRFCVLIYLCRATCPLFLSNLNPVPTVGLSSLVNLAWWCY